jgi:conjugal transfer pilus assembly protein TraW
MRPTAPIAIAIVLIAFFSLTANAIEADGASNTKTATAPIVTGETYPFAEQDLLDQIQKHIEANKEAIEARLKTLQGQAREKIKDYKPKDITAPLPRATADRTFEPDMSYVVQQDIKDARGVVIYPKGYRYNPLDYVWLKTSYVVIDATDRLQIEWLKQSGFLNKLQYQIWLSNGNWQQTSKELNQSVFFVNQAITDRFQLKRVPSLIRQTIDPKTSYSVVKVQEICIDCNKTGDKTDERSELDNSNSLNLNDKANQIANNRQTEQNDREFKQ